MRILILAPPESAGPADEGRMLAALTRQALEQQAGWRAEESDARAPARGGFDVVQVCLGANLEHGCGQVIESLSEDTPIVLFVPRLPMPPAAHEAAVIWSLAACADFAAFASQGDRLTLAALADSRIAPLVSEPLPAAALPVPTGADFGAARGLGRFVLMDEVCEEPPGQAQESAARCVSMRALGALSAQETADAYASAAAFLAGAGIEGLRRALDAALCGCAVVCPDNGIAREVLGDGAHYYVAGDGESMKQALAEALEAPRGDVLRARALATGADRHPLLHLQQVCDRAADAHRDREKRAARLNQALALHALAWKEAACYWAARHEETAAQAADLHRRLSRLSNLPLVRQALEIKRRLGR